MRSRKAGKEMGGCVSWGVLGCLVHAVLTSAKAGSGSTLPGAALGAGGAGNRSVVLVPRGLTVESTATPHPSFLGNVGSGDLSIISRAPNTCSSLFR